MARNTRRSKGLKKLPPAPMTLTFEMGGGGTSYIDLSLAASIMNRRFYRQGMNWAVAGMTVYASGENKTVRISTLQKNWCTFNAWKKGFDLWKQMNAQVLDTDEGVQGKYADFKIFLDRTHMNNYADHGEQDSLTDTAGRTLLPIVCVSSTGASELPDNTNREWNYSEYIFPQDGGAGPAVTAGIHMNGASSLAGSPPSVGLISGYGLSRSRPNVIDPNAPIFSNDSWMAQLFDVGATHEDIRENLEDENDNAPYALRGDTSGIESYPGGEVNLTGLELVSPPITSSAGTDYSGRTQIPGFTAPCGLICVKNDGVVTIQVHLVPGDYKGYMAVPMQEM